MKNKKIALVTGAAKGMGLEWVKQLSTAGYTVILTARSLKKAEDAVKDLGVTHTEIVPMKLEITESVDRDNLAKEIALSFGKLDLLVNNAGINSRTRGAINEELFKKNVFIDELDAEELTNMVNVNATSPILLANALKDVMAQSENPMVVNISSWMSSITIKKDGGNYSYAVSKAALNMMNRAFANDVKPLGITSVVVNPGWVQTDMGGAKAALSPQESISSMIKSVVNEVGLEQSGEFFNYDGAVHPW